MFVRSVVDTVGSGAFERELAGRVDHEVKRSANLATATLAQMDPRKPKWARVPSGHETCGFCIMLASRGYEHHSEETASHAPPHCDCRVVQGYEGAQIEGYDPDVYYRAWKRLESAETIASDLYHRGPVAVSKEATCSIKF